MNKVLFYYSVVATLLLAVGVAVVHRSQGELARLRNNNEAFASETRLYKNRYNESAASVVALQLKLDEFREQYSADCRRIKALRLRLQRVESVAKAATHSEVQLSAPLRDTLFLEPILRDTASVFAWSDGWVEVEGLIRGGGVECRIESVDTLHQVVHRVPRKFLFFRFGTKAIRQEITSSNPHTRIVYAEYIELKRRHSRRR